MLYLNVLDPIIQFNPATFLCLSQDRTCISNVICHELFCVQWVKVRGGCLFCWYWWNCWPSLFKLSFHHLSADNCIKIHSVFKIINYFLTFVSWRICRSCIKYWWSQQITKELTIRHLKKRVQNLCWNSKQKVHISLLPLHF